MSSGPNSSLHVGEMMRDLARGEGDRWGASLGRGGGERDGDEAARRGERRVETAVRGTGDLPRGLFLPELACVGCMNRLDIGATLYRPSPMSYTVPCVPPLDQKTIFNIQQHKRG